MELEQLPPNKPNFGLVVALSAAVLVVILVLALLFVHWDGKHLNIGYNRNAQSMLIAPAAPPSSAASRVVSTNGR